MVTNSDDNPANAASREKLATVANFYTASRFVLTGVFVAFFLRHDRTGLIIALVCAIFAMISDYLDGHFARKRGEVSNFGKVFDPLADAFFFVAVFLTFAATDVIPVWLALPFLVREMTQHLYVRPMALRHGVVMPAKQIGKIKTTCQCFAAILVAVLEIVRTYDELLLPHFKLRELYGVFDTVTLVVVSLTALVSLYSIAPYMLQLRRLQAEPLSETP